MLGISYTFLSHHQTTSHFLKIPDTTPRVGFLPSRQWRVNANRDARVPSTGVRSVSRKRRELWPPTRIIYLRFVPTFLLCFLNSWIPPIPSPTSSFLSCFVLYTCIEGLRVSSLGTEKREKGRDHKAGQNKRERLQVGKCKHHGGMHWNKLLIWNRYLKKEMRDKASYFLILKFYATVFLRVSKRLIISFEILLQCTTVKKQVKVRSRPRFFVNEFFVFAN